VGRGHPPVPWVGAAKGTKVIVLKPFLDTATYRNVTATRSAVVNLTDDVRVFAQVAISNPSYPTVPAAAVRGVVLADCCAWRELEVRSVDSTPPRSRIETAVLHRGFRSDGAPRRAHSTLAQQIGRPSDNAALLYRSLLLEPT